MEESLDDWFKREILPHEAALIRFLMRSWNRRDEVDDLCPECYVRVYEAAMQLRPHAPKSFLFTTARHLMTDRIRRQRIVAIDAVGDFDALHVPVEELTPEARVSSYQELRRLAEAFDLLPPRCREVVWMRRVDDLSQKEVAARLGMTEGNVEKHVMRGMKFLARAMFRGAAAGEADRDGAHEESERTRRDEGGHGQP